MKTIQEIILKAESTLHLKNHERPRLVIASAENEAVLEAVSKAKNLGLQKIILIGDQDEIEKIAYRQNIHLNQFEVIHEENKVLAAEQAVLLIKDGHANMVMKGLVESAIFLKAVFRKDMGINLGKTISHVSVVELEGGNLRNAIAREAYAVITFPNAHKESLRADLNVYLAEMEEVWAITEPGLKLEMDSVAVPEKVLDNESTFKLIHSLYACPLFLLEQASSHIF